MNKNYLLKAISTKLYHSFLLVPLTGVERNAVVGDDVERRKKQIPIVQLNPGSTLNYKYAGEIAIRSSGFPYCVVRSTGVIMVTVCVMCLYVSVCVHCW